MERQARAQLEKILASDLFARSERLSRLLKFTVERTLEGKAEALKEYVLGVEVFDRGESFDPRTDTLVRVHARRLRAALAEYYSGAGEHDSVLIEFPKGGYVPSFRERQSPRISRRKPILGLTVAALAIAGVLVFWISRRQAPFPAAITSVAVLPFVDMTEEKDQQYFCDGLADEIITALSQAGLRVPGRTSSFQFKGKDADIRQIGAQLRVAAVLEGSVRKAGKRLRISVQLIKVADGYHLWSASFDRDTADILAIQDEVSRAVAEALNFRLTDRVRGTRDPEAFKLYLIGRFLWNKWTEDGLRKSIGYYQQAIARDPNYAQPYAGLGEAYGVAGHRGLMPAGDAVRKNHEAVRRALELNPNLPEARVALAMTKASYDWDWPGAERELRRALEINPRDGSTRSHFALVLMWQGRFAEAEAELERALDLDPLSTNIRGTAGAAAYLARRYDVAVERLKTLLELDPASAKAHITLSAAYAEQRRYPEALRSIEAARKLEPANPEALSVMGYAYAKAGRRDKARQLLGDMKQLSARRPVPALEMAELHLTVGDKDGALRLLEQAVQAHETRVVLLKTSPRLDALRPEPRFQRLLKKLRFTK